MASPTGLPADAAALLRATISDLDARIERQRRRLERLLTTRNTGTGRRKIQDPETDEQRDALKSLLGDRDALRTQLAELEAKAG